MSEYGILAQTTTGSAWANSGENGWKFKVGTKSITVTGLRVRMPNSESVICNLWDVQSSTLLATATISAVSGAWKEATLNTPVTLTSGSDYIVSAIGTNIYYYDSVNTKTTFNDYLTYVAGFYNRPATGSIPKSTESGYLYPFADIVFRDTIVFFPSGSAVYAIPFTGIANTSAISWTQTTPAGTSVVVSASTDGIKYNTVASGGELFAAKTSISGYIYVKVELTTTDTTVTPTVSDLAVSIQTEDDLKSILLTVKDTERFESAVGQITVAYDGGGTLAGEGGAVLAFLQSFTPTGLVTKPHQNDVEHIEISGIVATGTLTKIYYTNTAAQDQGHVEIAGITATGTLTKVSDI